MNNKSKEVATPALWEKETKILFCDLCLKEIERGNRPTTFFNKEGWQNIIRCFKECTGREYDKLQMKNKWDQLKKDWKIWKELKRGSTCLGWDPVKQTVDAPDEWWADRIAVVPAAKKFKFSGIEPEFEEKLDRMFGGVVPTGIYASSPSETGFAGNAVNLGTPGDSVDFIDVPSPDQNENEIISRSKRLKVIGKRKSGASSLRLELSEAVSFFKAECQASQSSFIEEALEILSTTTKIYADKDLYLFTAELIEDPVRRDIFVKMPAAHRVAFIRHFYNRINISDVLYFSSLEPFYCIIFYDHLNI
ncbi:L10-interacting MYB domain-containing protein-like [Phalaenopsis equestris]|uniref:L10-interacting MYB domain-containing protein-like n=1 Tax=Phalaenopsis equestris TaxID=78828 RepID=UPI0009E611F1|nr:L10-interacting MYB domain-containing protein-like [Phalaenopsis equestris]